jgi:hypothetical protein
MANQLTRLDEHLHLIDETLASLARRVQALEANAPLQRAAPEEMGPAIRAIAPASRRELSVLPALFGRTSLALGGAFLLRALTEAGHLPRATGLLIGLVYALAWLVAADRARGISASSYGVTTLAIGLPMVWEAVLGFQTLSGALGAAALGVVIGATIAVAWHRGLQALGAVAVLGGLTVPLVLMARLGDFAPFAILLLGLGALTLAPAFHRGWMGQAIAVAVVVDLMMAFAMLRALGGHPPVPIVQLLWLQAAFTTIYFSAFLARSVRPQEPLGGFAFWQAGATIAFGLGGAIAVSAGLPGVRLGIGILSAAGAVLIYGLGLNPSVRRHSSQSGSRFFTSLGLVLAIVAGSLFTPTASWPLALAGAAVVLMWIGGQLRLPDLAAQGVIVLIGGGMLSGVHSWVTETWTTSGGQVSSGSLSIWLTVASSAACFALLRRCAHSRALAAARAVIGAFVLVGLGTALLAAILPAVDLRATDNLIPTLRTAVLAGLAMTAAWTTRTWLAELRWLTYPLLAAGGVKLIVQDFRQSPPTWLFVALTIYGVALIVAPRALDRSRR